MRKKLKAEDTFGGPFTIDDADGERWLQWSYHVDQLELRVEIPLAESSDQCAWLYVNDYGIELDLNESPSEAVEAKLGTIPRVKLMQTYADEILREETRMAGLKQLEQAATAQGLYERREPHR